MYLSQVSWTTVTACLQDELINKLQSVLRSAARLVLRKRKFDHITDYLRDQLHFLPIHQRIQYKLGLLVYKCLRGDAPSYLADMISPVGKGAQLLRSTAQILLLLQHGQFAWVHGALLSLAQHYGTHCQ